MAESNDFARPKNVDTPTMVIPLASSYNERGILGLTNTVTNLFDQRKINSVYEPVTNSITGNKTLYLVKRPGVDDSGQTYGTTGQVAYLVHRAPGVYGSSTSAWVFSTDTNDQNVSDTAGTTTIVAVAGTHPAYVDHVAVGYADTVLLQTRVAATGAQRAFYSTTRATWTEITDTDFTGLAHRGKMESIDGFTFMADNTYKAIYNSDINSLSVWPADNYIIKQITQDDMQGLAKLGLKLIAFGSETAEVFMNAGNDVGSPLVRTKESARVGLDNQLVDGYTHYYTDIQGKIYFIGREAGGISLALWMYDGERFEEVSNIMINKILTENSGSNFSVNKAMFHGKQAVIIALSATTAATQRSLLFFPEWKEWFEWTSTKWTPVNNGEWYLGVGANQHKLYRISRATSNWEDAGTAYTMTHQFKLPSENGNARKFMSMFGVVGDTARSASSLGVQFSDDDWTTFQTARNIDMTSTAKKITGCGSYQQRGVRLTHTANLDCRLESALIRLK